MALVIGQEVQHPVHGLVEILQPGNPLVLRIPPCEDLRELFLSGPVGDHDRPGICTRSGLN